MVELEIDGKTVEVPEGSMVIQAAHKVDTYIPHFCYHKKLSIAANCRMCLVEVEKMPKAVPACATPVSAGMIVRTTSDKAVKAQQSVMEFLLINHPLDCPICDQGGECQLQDLAVGYGKSQSRYSEEKRVVFHKNVGPLISMEEMSRCIHCTRCVRFGQEVAGVMELGMLGRGEHSEITSFVGKTVDSELSGNMIDLCPVGALDQQAVPLQRADVGTVAPQVGEPARFRRREPRRAGEEQSRDARSADGERSHQRMLDLGQGPLLVRRPEQRRASHHADAQAGRQLDRNRLADRARIRREGSEGHQGGSWRERHRRSGHAAQHGRRTASAEATG